MLQPKRPSRLRRLSDYTTEPTDRLPSTTGYDPADWPSVPTDPDYVVIGLLASPAPPHLITSRATSSLRSGTGRARCCASGNSNAFHRTDATGLLAATRLAVHAHADAPGEVPAVILAPEGHQVRQEYLSHLMRGPARATLAGHANAGSPRHLRGMSCCVRERGARILPTPPAICPRNRCWYRHQVTARAIRPPLAHDGCEEEEQPSRQAPQAESPVNRRP